MLLQFTAPVVTNSELTYKLNDSDIPNEHYAYSIRFPSKLIFFQRDLTCSLNKSTLSSYIL